jgi:hypothetical protein
MIARFAPALAAVLAGLAAPALAQDATATDPPQEPATVAAEPALQPADVVSDSASLPGDGVAPAIQRAIPASPFSLEQRNGWLMQCRMAFLQRGAALGGGNGLPDACETQLAQYESTYSPPADGSAPAPIIMVRVPVARAPADPPEADLDPADGGPAGPDEPLQE